MRRNQIRSILRRKQNDSRASTLVRVVAGAAGVIAGLFVLRSIPDLIRYVKMERM